MKTLKERYGQLKDKRVVGAKLGVSNIDLYFKDKVLDESDESLAESRMVQMENIDSTEYSVFQASESVRINRENRKKELRDIARGENGQTKRPLTLNEINEYLFE